MKEGKPNIGQPPYDASYIDWKSYGMLMHFVSLFLGDVCNKGQWDGSQFYVKVDKWIGYDESQWMLTEKQGDR